MTTDAISISTPASVPAAKPKRYHPAIVALHWIIAILIFATALLAGGEGGEGRRGGATIAGIPILGIHMILGITVLVLLVVRLIIRWRANNPEWATTGNFFLDKVGVLTHWALYFLMFAITITGIILAMQGNRFARTFGLAGTTPRQFAPGQFQPGQFPPNGQSRPGQFQPRGSEGENGFGFGNGNFFFQLGRLHGLSWALLFLLILLHVGAALYHQFIVKDNLFSRMWFGSQTG